MADGPPEARAGQVIVRPAVATDAATLAAHRAGMCVAMQAMTEQEAQANLGVWTQYAERIVDASAFIAVVATIADRPVGSGVAHVSGTYPSLASPTPWVAHISSMFVEPDDRRQGIAERVLRAIVAEGVARGVHNFTLNATPAGQGIYERFGFAIPDNPTMRYRAPDGSQ